MKSHLKEKDWVIICKKCGDELGIVYESKEPQYLYVHRTNEGDVTFEFSEEVEVVGYKYIGKIKLEDE